MFIGSRAINHLPSISAAKQVIRCHRNFARRRNVIDPGIQNRKNLLEDEKEMEQLNDYDFDMEANFMNLGKTYQEHARGVKLQHEKEKYLIVKQKYFKEKLPNFLTWSDKQQIRYLYNTNPEEWSIEKLSEGFPALPDVIAKIAKSVWTKDNDNKIRSHDKAVQENWALFKQGKHPDLPSDLVEHLHKFSGRKLNFEPFKIPEEAKAVNNKKMLSPNIKTGTEFSEIITSYERVKKRNINDSQELRIKNKVQKPPKQDTYILGNSSAAQHSKHITLEHLENKIVKKAQRGEVLADEKFLLQELQQHEVQTCEDNKHRQSEQQNQTLMASTTKSSNIVSNKYTSVVSTKVKSAHDYSMLTYPERIVIPKDKLQPGYTYKLNDCYYDDDGEFLYRVPGMYK